MTQEKSNRRTEVVVFASLATALVVGVVLLLALPGRKPPEATTSAASASTSAPKPIATTASTWQPPNFEDPDSLPPLPVHEEPEVVASGNEPAIHSKVPMHAIGEPEDEAPLTKTIIDDTVTRLSPRLKPCAIDKPVKITVLVELEPDGWVKSTKVQSLDGPESVGKCVTDSMQRWHFASTTAGGTASIPLTIEKK